MKKNKYRLVPDIAYAIDLLRDDKEVELMWKVHCGVLEDGQVKPLMDVYNARLHSMDDSEIIDMVYDRGLDLPTHEEGKEYEPEAEII